MKVLLVHGIHIPIGGADKVYFNTGNLLTQYGHEVIYFSHKSPGNTPCKQEKYFVEEPSKLQSILNAFYNRQASERIEQLILDEKPHIAHLHSFWGGLTPSILTKLRKHNIPVVHTVHDYNLICPVTTSIDRDGNICESCHGKYFQNCVYKRCFKGSLVKSTILASGLAFRRKYFDPVELVDGFIFPSDFVYRKHLQYIPGLAKSNNLLLFNFNPAIPPVNKNQRKRKYFLYLGRLSYEKGLVTLINTFMGLKDLRLMIVGTGPLENTLKSRVQKSGCSNIEFAGFKSGDELHSIVAESSFNIVPSEWWENNPMSIIESYSAGIPVIGADVGGIPEIISDGKTGYLFEMKNVEHLSAIIRKAGSLASEEYMTISNNAYNYAKETFNKEQNIKSLVEFYERIIQNKKDSL